MSGNLIMPKTIKTWRCRVRTETQDVFVRKPDGSLNTHRGTFAGAGEHFDPAIEEFLLSEEVLKTVELEPLEEI